MTTTVSHLVIGRPRIRTVLATLADLHQPSRVDAHNAVLPTGFDTLDEVLAGGIRPGEVLLLGGKPGVGKTVATLQWARSMAERGAVAVYLCYEHDEVALVTRLLLCELGELMASTPGDQRLVPEELRARLRDVAAGAITLGQAVESDRLLERAHRRVAAYGDRFVLVTGSGAHTNVPAIAEVTKRYEGRPVALFVDYLQKVPVVPADAPEAERAGRAMESLKQLALDQGLAVVANCAADRVGLEARRLHASHLRGSTVLTYEADAIIMLNEKLEIVSRVHVSHSPTRAEEFQREVVFSVEKNRSGGADADLQFQKDFAHYRFHPRGRWVAERLWTEGSNEP